MKNKNCPNCGAPYETEKNKCPYCGTSYFDMSGIDFTNREPFYLKIKSNMNIDGKYQDVYITQLVIPQLGSMEMSYNTVDAVDHCGATVHSFIRDNNLSTNISFTAIPNKDGSLMNITYERD